MKLTEFNNDLITTTTKALKEHYEIPFNVNALNKISAQAMLRKVRGLINEARQSPEFHQKSTGPAYMKLVFMEQSLATRFNQLLSQESRIVVENEEVEKSQVVLAAQDMVDSIQKMLEDVGQMQVKELPALVSSIESEIGVNEGQSYNDQATQQLEALSTALKEAFSGMKSALGVVTGQGGEVAAFDAGAEIGAEAGLEAGAEMGAEAGLEAGAEMGDEEIPEPEEEPEDVSNIGRAKR
jgi:hypothetical protein